MLYEFGLPTVIPQFSDVISSSSPKCLQGPTCVCVCLNGVLYMEIGGEAMQTGHTTPNFWNLNLFPNVSRLTT